MVGLTDLKEAWRIYQRARSVKKNGFKQYEGGPEQICRSIIEDAFSGHYRVSSGHFTDFYVRDFSWVAHALIQLGYDEEVRQTLEYALKKFVEANRVTTMITPSGEAFDFPCPGPDSLALFLYTIRLSGNEHLCVKYHAFLQEQVTLFVDLFVDRNTMLPKKGRFTSMRDNAKRDRSCYDATMIALVARECEMLSLNFPWPSAAIRERLKETYWNGSYFFSDMQKQNIVTGDSNVFPFWTGIFTEKGMLEQALTSVQAAGLDEPFPLKYVSTHDKHRENISLHIVSWFMPDYETDAIWAHMAMPYIELLTTFNEERAKRHIEVYTSLLQGHKTFLEVYDTNGQPYQTRWYVSDEAMSWCAAYLVLAQRMRAIK